ncbi:MAG: glycine-rich domain-containing protein-like [Gemmatales bacterium]|nr:glycine-rich domain-containing protein-like [Gemmatales bacterium]MDW8388033.1 glycine-rich domain-containing protein-like [Gemmatales bacterium]
MGAAQLAYTTTQLVDVDLGPVLLKLKSEGELLHGEPIDPDAAELAYRRFLTLHKRYPNRTLVPSALIDLVWHYHILDTRKYAEDCNRIFGYFLHHDPYFGIDEETREQNRLAWADTQALWEEEFGEPLTGPSHRCSMKDCR